jgi:hypothetical protein
MKINHTPSHLDRLLLATFLNRFGNSSLFTGKGDLLFSQDPDPLKTTTSRLVCFQLVKKYLKLQPQSAVICNDPQNGGTDLHRLFFIYCINENLYLVWDQTCPWLDLKIPPTPWLDKGVENSFILDALFSASKNSDQLKLFFSKQLQLTLNFKKTTDMIALFSSEKYQRDWFKVCSQLLTDKLKLRAEGDVQKTIQYKNNTFKIRILITEKQQLVPITIDFSGTSAAQEVSAATHIVESGLLVELIKYYGLEGYLCQPLLNAMKLVLPPKSVVAKSHPEGLYNFELQKISRQLIKQCLVETNSFQKKETKKKSLYSTYFFTTKLLDTTSTELEIFQNNYFSNSRVQMSDAHFNFVKLQNRDKGYLCTFKPRQPIELFFRGITSGDDQDVRCFKLNNKLMTTGNYSLTTDDSVEITWVT